MAEHWRTVVFELWCWGRLSKVPLSARRSNQSILKEINPEYSLEGLWLKLKFQYFGHLMWRANICQVFFRQGRSGHRHPGREGHVRVRVTPPRARKEPELGERPGTQPSLELSGGVGPHPPLDFGLPASRTARQYISVLLSRWSVAPCYRSHGKWIQESSESHTHNSSVNLDSGPLR